MEQERNMWVRGNTLSLGIPLQTKTVEGKTVTTDDYYPPAGSEIHVFMVNQFTKREYEYTVDGNVVKFTDDGSLPLGVWGIEITVKEPTPHNYRTFECQEIEVVECSDALGNLPDGTILTSPAIFIQGPKGDPFTYEDFTPEQIVDLKKPATDAAAEITADYADLKADYADVKSDAQAATQAATDAAALANEKAGFANMQGSYAKNQGDYAKDQGDYAKAKGNYAKEQGDYAKSEIDGAKGDYESLNERFAAIETEKLDTITEEQFNEIFT